MKITFTGKINTKVWLLVLGMMIVLIACGQAKKNEQETTYMNITAKEAKELMDTETGYVILDVRKMYVAVRIFVQPLCDNVNKEERKSSINTEIIVFARKQWFHTMSICSKI